MKFPNSILPLLASISICYNANNANVPVHVNAFAPHSGLSTKVTTTTTRGAAAVRTVPAAPLEMVASQEVEMNNKKKRTKEVR